MSQLTLDIISYVFAFVLWLPFCVLLVLAFIYVCVSEALTNKAKKEYVMNLPLEQQKIIYDYNNIKRYWLSQHKDNG